MAVRRSQKAFVPSESFRVFEFRGEGPSVGARGDRETQSDMLVKGQNKSNFRGEPNRDRLGEGEALRTTVANLGTADLLINFVEGGVIPLG